MNAPIDRHFVSFPKSGRSWIRYVLFQLDVERHVRFHHDQYEFSDRSEPAHDVDLSRRMARYATVDRLVYMERDPRDVMVSFYHQIKGRMSDVYAWDGSISEFIRDDFFGAPALAAFRAMWSRIVSEFGFHRVTYEECQTDIHAVMTRLLRYYGFEFSQFRLSKAIERATFVIMREVEDSGSFPEPWLRRRNDAPKLREGRVGSFREILGEEDISYLDRIFGTTSAATDAELIRSGATHGA